eukprot:s1369_g2.t1
MVGGRAAHLSGWGGLAGGRAGWAGGFDMFAAENDEIVPESPGGRGSASKSRVGGQGQIKSFIDYGAAVLVLLNSVVLLLELEFEGSAIVLMRTSRTRLKNATVVIHLDGSADDEEDEDDDGQCDDDDDDHGGDDVDDGENEDVVVDDDDVLDHEYGHDHDEGDDDDGDAVDDDCDADFTCRLL